VLGVVFLGDRLTLRDMAGALVIATALVIIDGRVLRRNRSNSHQ
jgi:drug/metabolite transporter (DMT)-like permease